MALNRKDGILFAHAAAVIDHLQQLRAATLDDDLDPGGAGIDGVFDQLFAHRRRRSMTSPAAILLIKLSGNTRMVLPCFTANS